jgi:hypothetical protein
MPQNFDLYDALFFEPLLVPYEFDGDMNSFFVVVAFSDLTKRALSKERQNFVAVPNVIVFSEVVVAAGIIVA